MTDREKVVRAVETCFDSWSDKHRNMGLDLHKVERMKRDALELLKDDETQLIYRDEIIKAHEDEIERLNELLKEQEPIVGWISVKENLPKVSGHYLVSCVNNKTGHRWVVPVNAEWLTSRHEWYIETGNCLASAAGVTVTHYMPLPEPPKEFNQ